MDINLMTLNAGNSRLAIGVFSGGELRHIARVPNTDLTSWPAAIRAAWAFLDGSERPAIAAAAVNPASIKPLDQTVVEQTGQGIQWVGKDIELPISVLTNPPSETGDDRVLNVAAAYDLLGKACVVVDAGTAVTLSVCNDNGDFLGGAIAPGAQMMLQALHERTARLPLVEFKPPDDTIGTSTPQAMLHGVHASIRGLVKEMVERYATVLGRWPEVIATGGDARTLFDGWELIHAVSPDLTLYGIALAYTEHHIRHES